MIAASQFSMGYDPAEDRIIILVGGAGGEQVMMTFTRRITGILVNGLAALLRRSSVLASNAPEEFRDDLILLEHQEALAAVTGQAVSDAAEGPGKTGPGASRVLVTDIQVVTQPKDFILVFRHAQTPVTSITVSRAVLHRLLDAFTRKAEVAEWSLTLTVDWLIPDQTTWIIN